MIGSATSIKQLIVNKMAWASVLAIFVLLTFPACHRTGHEEISTEIKFQFVGDKPIAVFIPISFFPVSNPDAKSISIKLESSETAMLGDFEVQKHAIKFTPPVPFKRGLAFEVKYNGITIDRFAIDKKSSESAPALTNIYPTTDTVPENLLKIHLEFSEPMSELHSSNYVSLLNESGDTLDHIFLRLDPELWNYDHTMLTLWLEPGRIKKSLLPNVLDGIPIEEGNHYTIAISDQWKSAQGVSLQNPVHKHINVTSRDENMPSVDDWKIESPDFSTLEPLSIYFHEALDYTSVLGSFNVVDSRGVKIDGSYNIFPGETGLAFIPDLKWNAGPYTIHIDGSVEDLAANNLNRLFDRDLEKDSTQVVESNHVIMFNIVNSKEL